MDNHEYLTNLLYDEFTSIHSLKEERGLRQQLIKLFKNN